MIKKEFIPIIEYYRNYRLLYKYDYSKKYTIWKNHSKCFYCNKNDRIKNKDKFNQEAHAVPNLLESRLYNYDECDECNIHFANCYENELSLFLNPIQGLLKNNHKFDQNGARYYNKDGDIFIDPKFITNINYEIRTITCEYTAPVLDNLDIYCALLKMALSVFDREKRKIIQDSIDLLFRDFNKQIEMRFKNHFILFGMNNELSQKTTVSLYKRHTKENCPLYFLFIQHRRFFYQIYLPFLSDETIFNLAPATIFDKVADFQHIPKARYEIKYVSEISPKKKENFTLVSTDKEKFENYIKSNNL